MPVIKSARKKLRQDKVREKRNDAIRKNLQKMVKTAQKAPSQTSVRDAVRALDRAVKKHLLHKNKAARLKSALAKLIAGKSKPAPKAPKVAETSKAKKPSPQTKKPLKK